MLGGYLKNQDICLGYVATYQKPWLGDDVQVDIPSVGYHPS
jgi:hypothetical protein